MNLTLIHRPLSKKLLIYKGEILFQNHQQLQSKNILYTQKNILLTITTNQPHFNFAKKIKKLMPNKQIQRRINNYTAMTKYQTIR